MPQTRREEWDGLTSCALMIEPEYEHSEQARAPHTNGPRNVPRCGALSLLRTKTATIPHGDSKELLSGLFVVGLDPVVPRARV
jgi:hypothetical protein